MDLINSPGLEHSYCAPCHCLVHTWYSKSWLWSCMALWVMVMRGYLPPSQHGVVMGWICGREFVLFALESSGVDFDFWSGGQSWSSLPTTEREASFDLFAWVIWFLYLLPCLSWCIFPLFSINKISSEIWNCFVQFRSWFIVAHRLPHLLASSLLYSGRHNDTKWEHCCWKDAVMINAVIQRADEQ